MVDKYAKATEQVVAHVDRAHDAISEFRSDGINADGVLMRPLFQAASLNACPPPVLRHGRSGRDCASQSTRQDAGTDLAAGTRDRAAHRCAVHPLRPQYQDPELLKMQAAVS